MEDTDDIVDNKVFFFFLQGKVISYIDIFKSFITQIQL